MPGDEDTFVVAEVEPQKCLVLGTYIDLRAMHVLDAAAPQPNFHWRTSWAFFLEELDRQRTRLLVRGRADYGPRFLIGPFARIIAAPLHFIMQRKQLIGVKQRVKRESRNRAARSAVAR